MSKPQKFESELLGYDQLSPTVRNFKLKVPEEFTFKAGQFIQIFVPEEASEGKKNVSRLYSIASAPHEKGHVDLCIKKVEGGVGSNYIFSLKKGDKFQINAPLGFFEIKDREKEISFIATGTGIAPFRAMIKDLIKTECNKNIYLFLGVRTEEEKIFEEELQELEDNCPYFKYYIIVSNPMDKEYEGEIGWVQALIEKYLPKEFEGHYYLCGLFTMIDAVKKELMEKRHVPEEHIFFERYD